MTNSPPARAAGNAPSLEQISHLAQAGAPELAISLLERAQPPFSRNPSMWLLWERERIHIYQTSRNWQALSARAQHLPAGVPGDFRIQELTQAAEAKMKLGDSGAARHIARQLIFGADETVSATDLKAWRQLIIESYVDGGSLKGARRAMRRFRQDYHSAPPGLTARLLLRTDQPAAALAALKGASSVEAGLLRSLAKVRTGEAGVAGAARDALRLARNRDNPARVRARAWVVAADAAMAQHHAAARITALEHALALESKATISASLWKVNADALWHAYLQLGATVIDRLRLKASNATGLFLAASNRFDSQPQEARALLAVVAFHAGLSRQRVVAHGQFALSLDKQPDGGTLLRQLYLHSRRFKSLQAVPTEIRYLLVKRAHAEHDVQLEARLMDNLEQPPPQIDAVAWQLRRAQTFMRAGHAKAGVSVLASLLSGDNKVSVEQALPVLFDLQAIGRDHAAIRFFRWFLHTGLKSEQRRHLLYWIAQSYTSLRDYRRAARLFLESATLKDPFALDQWAQSARYQAAKALARAGLVADAKRQYQTLLNASNDASRQAVLQHDIEQLELTEH